MDDLALAQRLKVISTETVQLLHEVYHEAERRPVIASFALGKAYARLGMMVELVAGGEEILSRKYRSLLLGDTWQSYVDPNKIR